MRTVLTLFVALTVATPTAFGADLKGDAALLRAARTKMRVGVTLVGLGAFVLPATLTNTSPSDAVLATGVGAIGIGTLLLWSGAEDRRKASPHTQLTLTIGRRTLVGVRHLW